MLKVQHEQVDEINYQQSQQFKKKDIKLKLVDTIYQCQCGKIFLSFPAIYSHAKNKHNVKLTSKMASNSIKVTTKNNQQVLKFKLSGQHDEVDQTENQFKNIKNIGKNAINFKFISKINKVVTNHGKTNIYGVCAKFLENSAKIVPGNEIQIISQILYLLTQCLNSHYMIFDQSNIYLDYSSQSIPQYIPLFFNFFMVWYIPSNIHKIKSQISYSKFCQILSKFSYWLKSQNYTAWQCQLIGNHEDEYSRYSQNEKGSIKTQ